MLLLFGLHLKIIQQERLGTEHHSEFILLWLKDAQLNMVEFLSLNLVPLLFFLVFIDILLFVNSWRFNYTLVNPRLKCKIRIIWDILFHWTFSSWFILAEVVFLNVDCVDQLSCLFHVLEFLGGIAPFTELMEIASPRFQAEVRCTGDLWYAV